VTSDGSSSERVLLWIPALAALAVAALYSVGALLTAARLRGAGLSVRDTLPLFSLEKILARGISTLIGSLLLLAALVLLGIVILSAGTALRRRDWSPAAIALATAAGVVLLIVGLAFASPVLACALILSLVVGVAGARFVPALPRVWIWGTQYLVVLGGLIASAYVYPQPLPIAHVELAEGGAPVVGDLVTTTDFTWYVAGFDDDEVRAIPAADIDDAEFVSREREDPPMLKDLVSDLFG
jgi:hypothetical protein